MPRPVVGARDTAGTRKTQAALKGTRGWSLTWSSVKLRWVDRRSRELLSGLLRGDRGGQETLSPQAVSRGGGVSQRLWDPEAFGPLFCLLPSSFPLRARCQGLPVK